jgi:hypothetical protein
MESSDPRQTAPYDKKLVPGARDHVPPEVRRLHQQIDLEGNYVDVEDKEVSRRLQPHCAYLQVGAGGVKCAGKVVRAYAYCAKHIGCFAATPFTHLFLT